ncbi:periplasmic glucan biosynthesis protein MdoG [Ancylobacter novellus DSM 506]|uniref:Periplasmic glucan biosynthesis protein MdoG n=1 Tax=Ancylobacter novellus (strain ATCC 8093 / DSM 506 / JCM 20403 / CCM 1077 / IAM 12100 / NBRC 12443 / NCIMB 10456) TaxID=639283 RepID=D7AA77_ANCN5|nr:glucan biosynthesis protein [Ancylobacter novellus]ADH90864.1 periplasmic glucan biosynthesis protein MdoG [Ancylobacter novellus DSM 506]
MRRREVLLGASVLAASPFLSILAGAARAQGDKPVPFDAQTVRQMAKELAAARFAPLDSSLPPELDKLSYDDYRNIRFNTDRSLWRGQGSAFEAQLLHRGFLFRDKVDIYLVAEGQARKLNYDQSLFRFEHGLKPPDPKIDLGFSGFRLHSPINRPDYFDEIAVFQGASYFRAIGKGQVYGSSARGLSIKTGEAEGEEFPVFKAFWLEQPRAGVDSVVIHALLDSPSAAAVHRFTIRPGTSTVMAVEMTLYPRVDLDKAGLASLTSMFMFGPNDRNDIDDFRSMVCDADGLAILTGTGERLWRPLTNPLRLQISAFGSTNVRGFGLMQRQRSFFDYQDLEARYERRPSVWVEPIGDWGDGAVHLVEIPTPEEVHDNIVAFWRPKEPMRKGREYAFTYRLHWCWDGPDNAPIGRFGLTRVGGTDERRQFVLDLAGDAIKSLPPEGLAARVTASEGEVSNIVLQRHPDIEGWRIAFAFAPKGAEVAELRAEMVRGEERLSESWVYRWTA